MGEYIKGNVGEEMCPLADTIGMTRTKVVRTWLIRGFRVTVGPRSIEEGAWRLKKAAALVKLLALAQGHSLHREQAMDLLWPALGKKAASNNLRQALHAARKTLDSTMGSLYLASHGEWIVLCPGGPLWVDVEAFEESAATARRSQDPAAYRLALDLYTGDLLPEDRYEGWAESKREELRQLHLALLVELAELYVERREYGQAVETLHRALSEEPINEEAHRALIRLYALSGRQEEALAQYERLQQILSRQHGTEPGITTRRLRDEIAAGRFPSNHSESLPLDELLGAGKHNLPAARTTFVGREQEIQEVKRLLAMTGLLTLTGTGGCGKTRLALEVARDLVSTYSDGVWLVELAPLSDPTLVPQAVAATLGVREQPGRPLLDMLLDALGNKEMLLVLDNCEHTIDAAAHLADGLLDSSPRLRLLATSREPLGATGELIWPVPSLSTSGPQQTPTVEELEGYESARLFVDRTRIRLPGYELGPENAGAVAEVCRRLEGIPLAIELAAARMDILTVEQIAERLDRTLGILTSTSWVGAPRHQTLRGALDWSFELLSQPERKLFARLSTFVGGFTLEAAEAVGAGSGTKEGDVLELFLMLVDKSLVVTEAAKNDRIRYRMLEPVRQYAQEKLEASRETDEKRHRHALWFLRLSEEAESRLMEAQQGEWFEGLEAEHDNLRAALSWSLYREEAELGLRLTAALWWFWYARGHLSEGRRWLEGSLSLRDSAAPGARARALDGAGWIAMFQGEFETAKVFLEKSLILFRELEDKEGIASTLTNLGFVAMLGQRDDISVPALFEEARKLRPGLKNRRTVAHLLILEGVMAVGRDDLTHAIELHEESLVLLRELREAQAMGGCLCNMGLFEVARTNYCRSTELLREALCVAHEADDKNIIQLALFGLANAAVRRGQPARAARLWGASEALREAFSIRLSPMARSFARYDDDLNIAYSQLGKAAFEAAWAEGKDMIRQQAVEYALSEKNAEPPTISAPGGPQVGESTGPLTNREQEVAILVAQGLTNHQISTELGISERTAGNHVARILRKLGLRSRTQIAIWVTERQLLAPYRD